MKILLCNLFAFFSSKAYFLTILIFSIFSFFVYGFKTENFYGNLVPVITYAIIGIFSFFFGVLPMGAPYFFDSQLSQKLLFTFSILLTIHLFVFIILIILHYEVGY